MEWKWGRSFFEVDKHAKIFTLLDLDMDIDELRNLSYIIKP